MKKVRRSIALPKSLIEEAEKSAPPELRGNFNGIMAASLRIWIESRKREIFRREMVQMGQDLQIQRELVLAL